MTNKHVAGYGCVWKNKLSDDVLSDTIYLGKEDDITNYVQIQAPENE